MPARNAMDFLSFIGEGEEQPPQARGRPRARGRGRGNSGRPVASAMEVLALIGEGDEQSPQATNPRGRPRARGRGRGNSGSPVASAMEVLALIGEGDEQPPQEKKKQGRPRGRPRGARKYNYLEGVKNQQKVLRFQMQKFNNSGRAVNMDGLMIDAAPRLGKRGPRPKVKVGQGGWKRYLPETIMRMAFSAGPARQVAASFDDAHRHSQGIKRSPACVLQCRAVCARTIRHVQERCLQVLYERSMKSDQEFLFWITNNMFDETKLWYILPGKGYRKWSTLLHHEQVTWGEGTTVFDDHVFHAPKTLRRYSSAGQWAALRGILLPDQRPRARFYGCLTAKDSHAVNILMLKHFREVSPATDVMLPSYCIQHHTGRCATDVAVDLKLFTRVWCLAKTFSEGDFHADLEDIIGKILEDPEYGLEVVNPEEFELAKTDLQRDFTESIMDRCFKHGEELGERTAFGQGTRSAYGQGEAEKLKEEFVAFFPFGWNRRRVLHPCPAGCCGPTPCHDRATSVLKSRELVGRVILKRINQPAQNKWTKLDPAFQQTTLVVCFFSLIKQALESKAGLTYQAVEAQCGPGPVGDEYLEAEDAREGFKQQTLRYSKRSLLFVGDRETQISLLIWSAVGAAIMNIHYRLFKHVSWYSEKDEEGYTAFNVCPGCNPKHNPAMPALTAIAKMIFDPNGLGMSFLGPIYFFFGATVHWPEHVLASLQRELVVAFCKLWRYLFHTFMRNPWSLAKVFNTEVPMAERESAAREFWEMEACCVDAWCGQPLRGPICTSWKDLFEADLLQFMTAMFSRCVLTSTFIEKCFAPLTTFTSVPRARHTFPSLASHHLLTVYEQAVKKWWETLDAPSTSKRARPVTVHLKPPGLHTCGWHLYVSEKDEWKRGSYKDNNEELLASMEQWTKLPAAKQKPYLEKAKKQRLEAKNQGSALDRALSHDFEECGGPWRLSASVTKRQADSSDGLPPKRRPAEWPIARVHIEREMDGMRLSQAWEHWQRKESKVWEEDPDFPGTVSMAEACFEGECLAVLTEEQRGQVAALGRYLRLALMNGGWPPELLPCVEFRAGAHIIYALVGNHGSTHELRCELISLKRPCGANGLGPSGSDVVGPASLPFELAMVQDVDCVHLDFAWPRVESERAFLRRLVSLSSGPWELYSLKALCEEVSTFMVIDRNLMDLGALEAAEVQRLASLHALNLFKKIEKMRAGQTEKPRFKLRRRVRAKSSRARGSTESADDESSSGSDSRSSDIPMAESDRPGSSDGLRPGEARPKNKRGIPWGRGKWKLAEIWNSTGQIIGCGATCGRHVDSEGDTATCKKQVTFGRSGLSARDLTLRLKRWLIAGLDDSHWDEEGQRSFHVNQGGRFMRDFAAGLSEEDCDRIANGEAALAS